MYRIFKEYPFFTLLLSIFFVFHGFTENYDFIPVKEASLLLLKYLVSSIFLVLLFLLVYKDFNKAGIVVFFILTFNFFFGNLYDVLQSNFSNTIIIKYSFIIPATFLIFILLIIYIKKTRYKFTLINRYLNWLFLILLLIDIGSLIIKVSRKRNPEQINFSNEFVACDSCPKPDIYLIVTDEYAGQKELKDIFGFDNYIFLNELKKRDYHVLSNSSGNYNFTHYSIASMLNMDYLAGISGDHSSSHDLSISFKKMKESKALNFFLNKGYSFYNYSIFNFNRQASRVPPTFISSQVAPITAQTFLSRLRRDLGYHLITTLKLKGDVLKLYYQDLYNNDEIYELTKKIAVKKTPQPKFVYTHLMMPHYRYYFNSKGEPTAFEKVIDDNYCADKTAYLEYLKYTNEKLLSLIDHIKKSSEKPPVIILMSDHGYHQFLSASDIKNVDKKYYFMNLNAVYFPNRNYSSFYDSMSNVNQFRVLLNSLFQQRLPLLKDSTIFLVQ